MYIIGGHMDGMAGASGERRRSGTALVMELARDLQQPGRADRRTIRFALWNNEETG
jgi:hypothetical protein